MRLPVLKFLKLLACASTLCCLLLLLFSVNRQGNVQHTAADDQSVIDQLREASDRRFKCRWGSACHNERWNSGSGSFENAAAAAAGEQQMVQWRREERHYCDHNLFTVNTGFAKLRNVIIDPAFGNGRPGGEQLDSVLNQAERSEYWNLKPGAMRVLCPGKADRTALTGFVVPFRNRKSHLNTQYLPGTVTISERQLHWQLQQDRNIIELNNTVIAITRYEYVNLYHTMTDFYSAFITLKYFGQSTTNVTILIIDGHPQGSLDNIWPTLFNGNFLRIGHLHGRLFVKNLIWPMMGYDAPLHQHNQPSLPMHQQFRSQFLQNYNLSANHSKVINCSSIRMTWIWRRDYIAHPRNPQGQVVRKVANEQQLLQAIAAAFPNIRVIGQALEQLSFGQQLKLITDTDILAGMHGAGLSHTLFLTKPAALLELYPSYWSPSNIHFRKMANWRQVHYERWVNHNRALELPHKFTQVPPDIIIQKIKILLHKLQCVL